MWWMSFAGLDEISAEKGAGSPNIAVAAGQDLEQVARVEAAGVSQPALAPSAPTPTPKFSPDDVWGLEFGSGGYAPYILRALESGTPAEANAGAKLILSCSNIDSALDAVYKVRSESPSYAASPVSEERIRITQRRQQYCQTVTPDIKALANELWAKAVRGNVPGSAAMYLLTVPLDRPIDPQLKAAVVSSLRVEASQGDMVAIGSLGTQYSKLGLNAVETRVYQTAYREIGKIEGGDMLKLIDLITLAFESINGAVTLSDEEQESAKQQAQQIVDAYVKKENKPGAGK